MDPGDALAVTIEASIALAGFSGIVVVLGRRTRGTWRPLEQLRLVNLLANGFVAFLTSLLGVLLLSTRLSQELIWSVCSLVWLGAAGSHSFWTVAQSSRLGDDDLRKSTPLFFWFLVSVSAVALALQILNVFALQSFWPFFAGISTSLGLGVRQFVVLLRIGVSSDD